MGDEAGTGGSEANGCCQLSGRIGVQLDLVAPWRTRPQLDCHTFIVRDL